MKKLSVIIPAYNSEKYLPKCLDSVLSGGDPDIEIVLVNDGSTDGTDAVCRHYAGTCPNIVYIRQENHGVAQSRITAIRRSTGAYITFLDSDDWIAENAYSRVLSVAAEMDSDIVIFGHMRCFSDGRQEVFSHYDAITHYTGRDAVVENLKTKITTVLWDKIFKRDLFWRPEEIMAVSPCFSDQTTTLRLLFNAGRVTIVPDCLVYYNIRTGSITAESYVKHTYILFEQLEDQKRLLKEEGIYQAFRHEYQNKCINLVFTYIIDKLVQAGDVYPASSFFRSITYRFNAISRHYIFNPYLSRRIKLKIFIIKYFTRIYPALLSRGLI